MEPTSEPTSIAKSPARIRAGKLNRQLRGPLTDQGRERLRQAALEKKPWIHSSGPTTAAGKAAVANNGRRRQKGEISARQRRKVSKQASAFLAQVSAARAAFLERAGSRCENAGDVAGGEGEPD